MNDTTKPAAGPVELPALPEGIAEGPHKGLYNFSMVREYARACVASAALKASAVPEGWQREGWKIEQTGDMIKVSHDAVGSVCLPRKCTLSDSISFVILRHLAETLLAAAPQAEVGGNTFRPTQQATTISNENNTLGEYIGGQQAASGPAPESVQPSIDTDEFRQLVKPSVVGLARYPQIVYYIDAKLNEARIEGYRDRHEDNVILINHRIKADDRAKAAEANFKNFHRSLCARFGYVHDEQDWCRDLVSLEEHIAKLIKQPTDTSGQPG